MLFSTGARAARRVLQHDQQLASTAAAAGACQRWFSVKPTDRRAMSLSPAKAPGAGAAAAEGGRREDFVGIRQGAALTPIPHVYEPANFEQFDIFQLMNNDGELVEGAVLPDVSEEVMVKMYKYMVRLQEIDVVFQAAHRQGRISFYMTSTGEEAAMLGSAGALHEKDQVSFG